MQTGTDMLASLIKSRRSVKPGSYTQENIDDEMIEAILESARWAPTHGLTEPWRFFVFSGEGLKKLADFLSGLYKNFTPEQSFNGAKYEKISTNILKASHIIMLGMQRQPTGKIPEIEEVCAVASAAQNMQLTASAYGLGAYWSTGSMSTHEETKRFLGLGEADKCLGMLYLAHYKGEIAVPARTPISEKTVWIKE